MSGSGDYTQMFAIVRDAVKKEQQGDYDGAAAVYDRAGLLAEGLARGASDEQTKRMVHEKANAWKARGAALKVHLETVAFTLPGKGGEDSGPMTVPDDLAIEQDSSRDDLGTTASRI